MLICSFPERPILRLGLASVTVAIASEPRSITTTLPILTSSKTSKSTRSLTFASLEDIVRANLILTGVSSTNPNLNGDFAAGVDVWAGAAVGSVGGVVGCGCWGSADDDTIKHKAIKVAIRRAIFIV